MTEYDFLARELQKELDARAKSVAEGSCKSFDEYRNATGIIRGLALAVDLIKDREQKLEDSDE